MAGTLNFDSLPTNNPFGIAPAGYAFATVEKAEIKKTKASANYLSVTLALRYTDGTTANFADSHYYESENEFVQFKLGRFISVLALGLSGNIDMSLVAKAIVGRKLGVLVKHKEEEYKGQKQTKAEIDIFKNGYFSVAEFETLIKNAAGPVAGEPADEEADGPVSTPDNDLF